MKGAWFDVFAYVCVLIVITLLIIGIQYSSDDKLQDFCKENGYIDVGYSENRLFCIDNESQTKEVIRTKRGGFAFVEK